MHICLQSYCAGMHKVPKVFHWGTKIVEYIIFVPVLHRSDLKMMIKNSSKKLFPSPKTYSKHFQFTPIFLSFYVHIFIFCNHTTVSINRKTAKHFSTQFVFWILRNIYSTLCLQLEVTQPKQLYYETVRWTKLLDLKQWSNILSYIFISSIITPGKYMEEMAQYCKACVDAGKYLVPLIMQTYRYFDFRIIIGKGH